MEGRENDGLEKEMEKICDWLHHWKFLLHVHNCSTDGVMRMDKECLVINVCWNCHNNQLTLYHSRVTEERKENRMDATNLAVVFAPSIMRSPYGSGIMAVQKLPEQKKVIELLISQYSTFFS